MDWLFVPLGNFMQSTFKYIEAAGMNFNYTMIVIGTLLTIYWVVQMRKNRHNDKGFFKKDA